MRTNKIFATGVIVAGILLLSALDLNLAHSDNGGFFPLVEGTSWTYEGKERDTIEDSNQVESGYFHSDMRVVRSITRGHTTSALVTGFPSQLNVITQNDQGLFLYREVTDKTTGEEILKKTASGRELGDQILRFPVRPGDRLGQDPPRADSRYCWFVKGRVNTRYGLAWEVIYETLPDHEIFDFVPGVGIVHYQYQHHGTVMETDAHLVSYHIPSVR